MWFNRTSSVLRLVCCSWRNAASSNGCAGVRCRCERERTTCQELKLNQTTGEPMLTRMVRSFMQNVICMSTTAHIAQRSAAGAATNQVHNSLRNGLVARLAITIWLTATVQMYRAMPLKGLCPPVAPTCSDLQYYTARHLLGWYLKITQAARRRLWLRPIM